MPIDLDTLFPKLLDLLLDTVFVVDEEGLIVFVSTACETLLGYSQQEMTGSWIMDYVHPEDRDRTRAAAARIIGGASHIDFENRYVGKDGRAGSFYVALYDNDSQTVSFPYLTDDHQPPGSAQPLKAESAIAEVISAGKAMSAMRGKCHPELGEKSTSPEMEADWMGVPLVSGDRIIGVP